MCFCCIYRAVVYCNEYRNEPRLAAMSRSPAMDGAGEHELIRDARGRREKSLVDLVHCWQLSLTDVTDCKVVPFAARWQITKSPIAESMFAPAQCFFFCPMSHICHIAPHLSTCAIFVAYCPNIKNPNLRICSAPQKRCPRPSIGKSQKISAS